MERKLLRIIDANLNRAREGLRVCEELVRFILQDARLTRRFKHLRHKISDSIERFPEAGALLKYRQSRTDVGRNLFSKPGRRDYAGVFSANLQRVKESLRVLEEFSSLFNQSLSRSFCRMRFAVYELEKAASTGICKFSKTSGKLRKLDRE